MSQGSSQISGPDRSNRETLCVKLRNLADMESFVDREITEFFRQGVGLKSTAAYFRPENWRWLAAVIAAHPNHEVYGRTRLQKTVWLLQSMGMPTDYVYSLHFRTIETASRVFVAGGCGSAGIGSDV